MVKFSSVLFATGWKVVGSGQWEVSSVPLKMGLAAARASLLPSQLVMSTACRQPPVTTLVLLLPPALQHSGQLHMCKEKQTKREPGPLLSICGAITQVNEQPPSSPAASQLGKGHRNQHKWLNRKESNKNGTRTPKQQWAKNGSDEQKWLRVPETSLVVSS